MTDQTTKSHTDIAKDLSEASYIMIGDKHFLSRNGLKILVAAVITFGSLGLAAGMIDYNELSNNDTVVKHSGDKSKDSKLHEVVDFSCNKFKTNELTAKELIQLFIENKKEIANNDIPSKERLLQSVNKKKPSNNYRSHEFKHVKNQQPTKQDDNYNSSGSYTI